MIVVLAGLTTSPLALSPRCSPSCRGGLCPPPSPLCTARFLTRRCPMIAVGATVAMSNSLRPGVRSCWANSFPASAEDNETLHVVSSVTEDIRLTTTFTNFLFSMRKLDFYNVHFINMPPKHTLATENKFWELRRQRSMSLLEGLAPKSIAVFVDSMDGLWMRGPREVVNLYHSFESEGHKIIYAAEIMCDTNACRSLRAKNSEVANRTGARMKYINGGGVIGRREEMLTLYRKAADVMTSRPHLDDQAAVAVIHAQEPSILTLDSESRFFGTIPAMHDLFWRTFQFKNVGLVRKLEKTINRSFLPAYIHFPGMRMRLGHTSNPCQLFLGGVYNHVIDGLLRKTELKRRRRVNPARLELKGQPEDLLLPRIVVSLTTTRFRLSHLLPTLLSLLHQTLPPDAVVLNLGYDVTQLPSWLNHSLNGQIVVRWVKDEGPITKLLPTLRAESDPNTLIITADDDMIYQRRHIELLVQQMLLWPHCAYNFAGQLVDDTNGLAIVSADQPFDGAGAQAVDILEAFKGAVYRRDFFDDSFLREPIPSECWTTDDIWISRHLALRGIPRIRLEQFPQDIALIRSEVDRATNLRSQNVYGEHRNVECIQKHLHIFLGTHLSPSDPQPCPVTFSHLDTTSPLQRKGYLFVHDAWSSDSGLSSCSGAQRAIVSLERAGRPVKQWVSKGWAFHSGQTLKLTANSSLTIDKYGALVAVTRWHDGLKTARYPKEVANSDAPQIGRVVTFHYDGQICGTWVQPSGSLTPNWCIHVLGCARNSCRLGISRGKPGVVFSSGSVGPLSAGVECSEAAKKDCMRQIQLKSSMSAKKPRHVAHPRMLSQAQHPGTAVARSPTSLSNKACKGKQSTWKLSRPEKTLLIVTSGRTGSTTLMALLDKCIDGALIQGENDLSIWWLYKYWLSVGSYKVYSPQSERYPRFRDHFFQSTANPFHRKLLPEYINSSLRALVQSTLASACRNVRVVGLKEIRWVDRIQNDPRPNDAYWSADREDIQGYLSNSTSARLIHFLEWLQTMVSSKLYVLLLTRSPDSQARSGWFRDKDATFKRVLEETNDVLMAVLESKLRAHHITYEALRNQSEALLANLFAFLGEPFHKKCILQELSQRHSF